MIKKPQATVDESGKTWETGNYGLDDFIFKLGMGTVSFLESLAVIPMDMSSDLELTLDECYVFYHKKTPLQPQFLPGAFFPPPALNEAHIFTPKSVTLWSSLIGCVEQA